MTFFDAVGVEKVWPALLMCLATFATMYCNFCQLLRWHFLGRVFWKMVNVEPAYCGDYSDDYPATRECEPTGRAA